MSKSIWIFLGRSQAIYTSTLDTVSGMLEPILAHRMFCSLRFVACISQRALFNVLHAFALYCPDCGYCQGMGSLAATFLCYMLPEVCACSMFWGESRELISDSIWLSRKYMLRWSIFTIRMICTQYSCQGSLVCWNAFMHKKNSSSYFCLM